MARWQDIVLTVGSLAGSAALIPAIFHRHKPPLVTSIPTVIILAVFIPTYASLGLLYTTTTIIIGFLLWGTLAVQEYLIVRREASSLSSNLRKGPTPQSGGSER